MLVALLAAFGGFGAILALRELVIEGVMYSCKMM